MNISLTIFFCVARKKPKLMPDPSNAANKEAEENPVHDSYI